MYNLSSESFNNFINLETVSVYVNKYTRLYKHNTSLNLNKSNTLIKFNEPTESNDQDKSNDTDEDDEDETNEPNESDDYKLVELPNHLFASLKSLKSLILIFDNDMKLANNTFGDVFGKLKNLNITGYQRSYFSSGIFHKIREIKVLRITHNHLTSLSENIFDNLQKLEILDLSYNKFHLLGL